MTIIPDEKARGVILGLAVGDALGAPVEFLALDEIRRRFGPAGIEDYQRTPALFTDDTQMSVAVAEALVEAGARPLHELMKVVSRRFIEWRRSPENTRSPGFTTNLSVKAIEKGANWMKSGDLKSKGAGSVMRTAPIGYFYASDPARLLLVAQAVGVSTHKHPTADAACLAASLCLRLAVIREPLDRWFAAVLDLTKGISEEFAATMFRVKEALDIQDSNVAINLIGRSFNGWTADEVFGIALFCVLRHPDDFKACVLRAVNTSGDSDTIGCVAGAIQGARLGWRAIPSKWVKGLEKSEELIVLADRLASARLAAGL